MRKNPGSNRREPAIIRNVTFAWGERTHLMGIVNATPDSFSGDGMPEREQAVAHAVKQAKLGSDVVDVGGESTRPGYVAIDDATEIERVVPVIRALRALVPETVISADTYKPAVFRAAYAAGADMLNSVWGLPDELLAVALECDAPVIAMHNKALAHYDGDVVDEVLRFLSEIAERAVRKGMPSSRVILDPGIGFGKTAEHNLAVLRSLHRFTQLGFPTMVGTSRKSTIGRITGREPHERIYGTAATVALAIEAGIDMVRVHDVAQIRDVISVSDAVVRDWRPLSWT